MPGMGEDALRRQLRDLVSETDELRRRTKENDLWVENIKQVLSGDIPSNKILIKEPLKLDTTK